MGQKLTVNAAILLHDDHASDTRAFKIARIKRHVDVLLLRLSTGAAGINKKLKFIKFCKISMNE